MALNEINKNRIRRRHGLDPISMTREHERPQAYLCRCLTSKQADCGVFESEEITDDYYYAVILSGDSSDVNAFYAAKRDELKKMDDNQVRREWEEFMDLRYKED